MDIWAIPTYFNEQLQLITNQLSGGDSMAKGLITVGILGGLVHICRNIPKQITRYIGRITTVSVQFEDSWRWAERNAMQAAAAFIAENQTKRRFRLISIDNPATNDIRFLTGPQTISGMFFIGLRPYWYSSEDAKENGAVPRSVMITTIGRDKEIIYDAVGAKTRISSERKQRSYFTGDGKEWEKVGRIKSTAKLFLPKSIKEQLDRSIDFFNNNSTWYHERGINHKLLIIIDGPPGSGKSSIATYVANRLNWSLGTIGTPSGFSKMIRSACDMNMVVSVPDVDTLGIGVKRIGVDDSTSRYRAEVSDDHKEDKEKPEDSDVRDESGTLMTELEAFDKMSTDKYLNESLNLFQGDIPLNNSVVVMSTNCIDKLDPALLRTSRCDLRLTITALGYDEMNAFYQHYYSIEDNISDIFKDKLIVASDLMGAFTDNPFDKEGFLESIKDRVF